MPVRKRKKVEDVTTPTGLLPNKEYIEKGFHYYTDMHGRVIRAQGILQKQRLSRNDYNQSLARRLGRLTDDGGHLIAHRFGGSGNLYNLVPQDLHVNRSAIKMIENEMAKLSEAGYKVSCKVEVIYNETSALPSAFKITYNTEHYLHEDMIKNETPAK